MSKIEKPAEEMLARVETHDSEILDLRFDLGGNGDAFLRIALDPHWSNLPPSEDWETLTIRLSGLQSVESKVVWPDPVDNARRTVAILDLSDGILIVTDSLNRTTTLRFAGPATAWLETKED